MSTKTKPLHEHQKWFIKTLQALIDKERATILWARFPEETGLIPVVRIKPRGHRLSGAVTGIRQCPSRQVLTYTCQYQRMNVEWETEE